MRSADIRVSARPLTKQRRTLVAHAGARRGVHADQAIFGNLAALDPQLVAQTVEQFAATQHAVGDVVREQHAVAADRRQMEKRVETGDALDARARQAGRPSDRRQRSGRQVADRLLRRAQDLHQLQRIGMVSLENRLQPLVKPSCLNLVFGHPVLLRRKPFSFRRPSLLRCPPYFLMHVNNNANERRGRHTLFCCAAA
jgi:hypothetical protein